MEFNWSSLSEEKRDTWLSMCPQNSYAVVKPAALGGLMSTGLLAKYDSVVLVSSGVKDSNAVVFMANGQRADKKAGAIDQMPFGFACFSGDNNSSGVLIQHGNWEGRTTTPPNSFWTCMQNSGLGNCYPLAEVPSNPTGALDSLNIKSQTTGAFHTLLQELEKQYPELKA
jgi:hypothetical protein